MSSACGQFQEPCNGCFWQFFSFCRLNFYGEDLLTSLCHHSPNLSCSRWLFRILINTVILKSVSDNNTWIPGEELGRLYESISLVCFSFCIHDMLFPNESISFDRRQTFSFTWWSVCSWPIQSHSSASLSSHCYLALGILIFLTFLPVCQCN